MACSMKVSRFGISRIAADDEAGWGMAYLVD